MPRTIHIRSLIWCLAALVALTGTGCLGHFHQEPEPIMPVPGVPTELTKVNMPPYAIGVADMLLIDVYTLPREKGSPATVLSPQPISNQHLVRPDGTVNMGIWGAVHVAGMTTDQAREAVRAHVYKTMQSNPFIKEKGTDVDDPNKLFVVVDVVGYNSKAYYVITDGAGYGEQIYRFPFQGNETVIDALSNINGIPMMGSKQDVWVARRSPQPNNPEQILPVDYTALTQHGVTATNYQLFPGDRIYVKAEKIFWFDNTLQKVLAPIERLLGITLLGGSAYNTIVRPNTLSGQGY